MPARGTGLNGVSVRENGATTRLPLMALAGLIQPGAVVQQAHARRLIQPAVGIDADVGGSAHGLSSRPLVLGRIQPNGLRHNVV